MEGSNTLGIVGANGIQGPQPCLLRGEIFVVLRFLYLKVGETEVFHPLGHVPRCQHEPSVGQAEASSSTEAAHRAGRARGPLSPASSGIVSRELDHRWEVAWT